MWGASRFRRAMQRRTATRGHAGGRGDHAGDRSTERVGRGSICCRVLSMVREAGIKRNGQCSRFGGTVMMAGDDLRGAGSRCAGASCAAGSYKKTAGREEVAGRSQHRRAVLMEAPACGEEMRTRHSEASGWLIDRASEAGCRSGRCSRLAVRPGSIKYAFTGEQSAGGRQVPLLLLSRPEPGVARVWLDDRSSAQGKHSRDDCTPCRRTRTKTHSRRDSFQVALIYSM